MKTICRNQIALLQMATIPYLLCVFSSCLYSTKSRSELESSVSPTRTSSRAFSWANSFKIVFFRPQDSKGVYFVDMQSNA
jgi:hypothetical protein